MVFLGSAFMALGWGGVGAFKRLVCLSAAVWG